jgi:hypothetical protein
MNKSKKFGVPAAKSASTEQTKLDPSAGEFKPAEVKEKELAVTY